MNSNLEYYDKGRVVPQEAKKEIKGGKLKGFTDINPMWRIKKLTEMFGPCGLGWYYEIADKWFCEAKTGEVISNVVINLYVKYKNEWSQPIVGIGGNKFVSLERGELVATDEAYKMALTDALSVACKSLGIGADVYYEKDRDKYTCEENEPSEKNDEPNIPNRYDKPGEPQVQSLDAKIQFRYTEITQLLAKSKNIKNSDVAMLLKTKYEGKQLKDLSDEDYKQVYDYVSAAINNENNPPQFKEPNIPKTNESYSYSQAMSDYEEDNNFEKPF